MPVPLQLSIFHSLGKEKSCLDLLLEPVVYGEALAFQVWMSLCSPACGGLCS